MTNYMDRYLDWLESATPRERLNPRLADAGFCEDGWHDCGGYCGTCGIHLDEHGDRCNEYARECRGPGRT
jgi:hypothetical protein